ncbi:hypothetical protein AYI69_g2255 [Smittium culicis]|uniref:Uncharacterized protein n=1 Tax=Smittium culicis TaxID=133412 RepID=A0A1R1YN20_9FUNG|nr:hypothetical protein AYI69_g2255 [Smittium culicis]
MYILSLVESPNTPRNPLVISHPSIDPRKLTSQVRKGPSIDPRDLIIQTDKPNTPRTPLRISRKPQHRPQKVDQPGPQSRIAKYSKKPARNISPQHRSQKIDQPGPTRFWPADLPGNTICVLFS